MLDDLPASTQPKSMKTCDMILQQVKKHLSDNQSCSAPQVKSTILEMVSCNGKRKEVERLGISRGHCATNLPKCGIWGSNYLRDLILYVELQFDNRSVQHDNFLMLAIYSF